MNAGQTGFHLEEYKQIREEVTTMITKTEQLLQYCVVVSAAVFAWLATQAVGLNDIGNGHIMVGSRRREKTGDPRLLVVGRGCVTQKTWRTGERDGP
jgi:hypothetical protein